MYMNDNRVKYYSTNDLLFGYNLSKIETLSIPKFETIDINDAIEFFEIKRYFDAETRNKDWGDADYDEYKEKSKKLLGLTKRFFNQIDSDNIITLYKSVELDYHSSFWLLFDNCKLYDKISPETFDELINGERVSPNDLFLHKNIVHRYGGVLRKYILSNEFCVRIILHVYDQEYTQDEKLTLPTELTGEDICNYLENYIDGEHPDPNELKTIVNMHYSNRFPITDEVRLKAKRRYALELEAIMKNSAGGLSQGILISFSDDQDEAMICTQNDHEFNISYSLKWLLESLDYPSILNNFIYVFEFVDFPQMRCTHVNKKSQTGLLERIHASNSSRVYPSNYIFEFLNSIASLQMHIYFEFLLKQNIRLEDVIKWFFTEQLQSEFDCAEIRMSMPSPDGTYAEKCSSIITAFESVLKQYSLYIKNGEIDFELVGMSTTPLLFGDIKSLVTDKYIYGVGEEYKRLSFWFFSDQCTFSYVERIYNDGRHYDTLIELLRKENIYLSDYRESEAGAFKKMAEHGLVIIRDDERIELGDKSKLAILRDLYQNDVISRWHYPPKAQEAILDFLEKGVVETRSTLFSQPEINYLNYLLNRSEYSNGLEIRNRYIHGIQQVNTDEDEHKQNYFVLLRLFVLLAIKINDDFCLKELKE